MRYLLGDFTSAGGPGLVTAGPGGLGAAAAVADPSWVVVGPAAVYALSRSATEPGSASAWHLGEGGALEHVGRDRSTGGCSPCHGAVDASGRWLLVANYGKADGSGATVAVLPVGEGGVLGEAADVVELEGSGPHADRQAGPHAHQVVCRGERVFAVDLGSDRVHAFDLGEDGKLVPVAVTPLEPGFGPRHLAFLGDRAVIAGELAGAFAVGAYDERSGRFAFGSPVPLPRNGTASLPAAVVPDPARGLVYLTVRGPDALAVVDPAAGALLRTVPVGAAWPRDAVLAEDGSVLVACQHGGEVMRVDPSGGRPPVAEWTVPGVSCVAAL
jgi:6-phosphogluconolactonase